MVGANCETEPLQLTLTSVFSYYMEVFIISFFTSGFGLILGMTCSYLSYKLAFVACYALVNR